MSAQRNDSTELTAITAHEGQGPSNDENANPPQAMDLPPVDTGFGAYSYLVANFVLQLLVWTYAFSSAVFLPYYTKVLFPDHPNLTLLSLIGTSATGIMYIAGLVVTQVCSRWPKAKRPVMIAGLFVATLALVGAAFSTKPWQLLLTQGIGFSFGGSALYYPASPLMFEWFVKRRGLANGIMQSGTSVGGVVVPFMVNYLLHKYGQRTTFLVMAGIMCGSVLPVLPFLKSRFPASHAQSHQPARINVSVFHSKLFWCLALANWLQSLGHSVPSLYLPAFASDLHLSDTSGVLVLALLNGASVPGRIFMGFCSDRMDLRIPMLISTVGSAFAVFLLWGLSNSLALLCIFAVCYGFLAAGFSSMWPRFVSSIAKDDPHTSHVVLATFFAGRGVAYLVSTPISTGLLRTRSSWDSSARFAYGMKGYGVVIFFTGMIFLGSTIGVAFRTFEKAHRIQYPRTRSTP